MYVCIFVRVWLWLCVNVCIQTFVPVETPTTAESTGTTIVLFAPNIDCQPSTDWRGLGRTRSECSSVCQDYLYFVMVDGGDGNCKCCTSKETDKWKVSRGFNVYKHDVPKAVKENRGVCMYVCLYACVHVCTYVCTGLYVPVCMYRYVCTGMYALYVCPVCVCLYEYMYVHLY